MRKIIFSMFVIAAFAFNNTINAQTKAKMVFKETTHNFKKIPERGGKVSYKFAFTNSGNDVLIISEVNSSCGCTTPKWTKAPIPPGTKGYIEAEYNPMNRPGTFNKSVTVISNAEKSSIVLKISGDVIPNVDKISSTSAE